MHARSWIIAWGLAALALPARNAPAQILTRAPTQAMTVVIRYNDDIRPWDLATRMANATGMELVGVSPSTNSAVYHVPNETNLSTGAVAAANQRTLTANFPNTIQSYNYGVSIPIPADVQAERPYGVADRGQVRRGRRALSQNRFTQRDRQAAQDWFDDHQDLGARLRVGSVLDPTLLSQSITAPADLTRRLTVPPANLRYLLLGDNLVMVDSSHAVQDIIYLGR